MTHHHIDYIEFPASKIQDTKAFYSNVFGWKFTDYGPDYVSFENAGVNGGFTTDLPCPGAGTLIVLYSADLAATETGIVKAGGVIVKPVFEFPGGRRFHFTDPNGNELAVWSE